MPAPIAEILSVAPKAQKASSDDQSRRPTPDVAQTGTRERTDFADVLAERPDEGTRDPANVPAGDEPKNTETIAAGDAELDLLEATESPAVEASVQDSPTDADAGTRRDRDERGLAAGIASDRLPTAGAQILSSQSEKLPAPDLSQVSTKAAESDVGMPPVHGALVAGSSEATTPPERGPDRPGTSPAAGSSTLAAQRAASPVPVDAIRATVSERLAEASLDVEDAGQAPTRTLELQSRTALSSTASLAPQAPTARPNVVPSPPKAVGAPVLPATMSTPEGTFEPDPMGVGELAASPARNDGVPLGASGTALPSRADLVRSIAAQIADQPLQARGRALEVALDPEELGSVRISVTQTETGLAISIQAERGETVDLIRRYQHLLEAEMRGAGFASVDVDLGRRDGRASPFQTARSDDGSQTETVRDVSGRTDGPRLRVAASGLDMRI